MTDGDMHDHEPTATSRHKKQLAGVVGLLLVGAIAGVELAAISCVSAAGNATQSAAASSAMRPRRWRCRRW